MDDQYAASDYDASSDEPFIGGVDSVADDTNNQYDETSYINTNSSFTPLQLEKSPKKRRGRPPKAEHEKQAKSTSARPSGAIRISLTPKSKAPRSKPVSKSSPTEQGSLASGPGRPRGRPRIHPPKDTSEKKPRGRPRKQPIEGEKAWQSECARLRRVVKNKDVLISRLKQKLSELGATLDETAETMDLTEDGDGSGDAQNGAYNNGETGDVDVSQHANEEQEPSHIEDTHQTYVEMFARDSCQSDDQEEDSESG